MSEESASQNKTDLVLGFPGLKFTERDRKVFLWIALVSWVLFAAAFANAIVTADVHRILTNLGLLMIFSTFLLDRHGLRIFATEPGSQAEQVLHGVTLFGLLIAVSGWVYRFLY